MEVFRPRNYKFYSVYDLCQNFDWEEDKRKEQLYGAQPQIPYQILTEEQFKKVEIFHSHECHLNYVHYIKLNHHLYEILEFKELKEGQTKYLILRGAINSKDYKPTVEWVKDFNHEDWIKGDFTHKTLEGYDMFTLTKNEIMYVGAIDDSGQEFILKVPNIII